MSKVIQFPGSRRIDPDHATGRKDMLPRSTSAPIVSLDLLVKGLPPSLRPLPLAREILATGSNEAALPIWTARKAGFLDHLAKLGIKGKAAADLVKGWRDAVRAEGIAEKARRKAAEDAVFRMFERMAAGLDPTGGDRA